MHETVMSADTRDTTVSKFKKVLKERVQCRPLA